jgi:hypothetical protein
MNRFLIILVCASAASGWAAAPPNDRFSNAITLTGTNLTVTGSSTGATKENGEPDHAENPGGSSVWWTWTAPADGEVQITTDQSSFDTLVGVYVGPRVSALTEVASNDDHGLFVSSRVRFQTTQGTTYQIAVDGFDGAAGEIVLAIGNAGTRLSAPVHLPTGAFQFTVIGMPGRTNEIFASEDFGTWTSLGTIRNTSGAEVFTDLLATNSPSRFYRALVVP